MRLTKEQVEKLSGAVLERLKQRGLVVFKADELKVLDRMNEVFLADLRAEDVLDKEVEEMLRSRSAEMDDMKVDYRRMFNMLKGKIARERGIVL
jgi:hypothetical protein